MAWEADGVSWERSGGVQVAKAEQYKTQLTQEMDELTANLFEEAHEMVRVEKEARFKDNTLLRETQDKSTVLQVCVSMRGGLSLTGTRVLTHWKFHSEYNRKINNAVATTTSIEMLQHIYSACG